MNEENQPDIQEQIEVLLRKLDYCLNAMYKCPDPYTWSMSIKQIRAKLITLQQDVAAQHQEFKALQKEFKTLQHQQAIFTLEELAKFNGKNDKPAYVAVNGIVYDVTRNATWAAATHFGLAAGNDLTKAYTNCHPKQNVLSQLPVAGTLK